jgi:hypothetical protein
VSFIWHTTEKQLTKRFFLFHLVSCKTHTGILFVISAKVNSSVFRYTHKVLFQTVWQFNEIWFSQKSNFLGITFLRVRLVWLDCIQNRWITCGSQWTIKIIILIFVCSIPYINTNFIHVCNTKKCTWKVYIIFFVSYFRLHILVILWPSSGLTP